MTNITISHESLYHYRCGHCNNWWSVADIEPVPGATVSCPHCHAAHQVPNEIGTGKEGVTLRRFGEAWIECIGWERLKKELGL